MTKHKFFHSLSAVLVLALSLTGCTGKPGGGQESASTLEEFRDTVYAPKHASRFVVTETIPDTDTESGDVRPLTLLTVHNPWQGAADADYSIIIVPEGVSYKAPEDFKGTVLHGEARRIVAMSSTHVAMLDAIGVADRIVGVSGLDYISSPKVAQRADRISDVGYEGNINYEALTAARPDIVLLYGVNSPSQMEAKLRELSIPFIYVGDYLEESPLGKSEWMVALGALTGRLQESIEAFTPIEKSYETTANMVSSFLRGPKPKVMFNAPTGDQWFLPPKSSYMVRLIEDAGGEYVYPENDGSSSVSVDMEMARALMSKADYWLNPGTANDLRSLTVLAPKMADTPPVRNGRVWNNNLLLNPSGGNDFFESGTVRPDRVLNDLVMILHPETADSLSAPVYYRHIF